MDLPNLSNLSVSLIATPTESFHLFPNLPSELRIKIWMYCSSFPRIIDIWYLPPNNSDPDNHIPINEANTFKTTTPPPYILSSCQESRIIALQHYIPLFNNDNEPLTPPQTQPPPSPKIYINPQTDTLLPLLIQHSNGTFTPPPPPFPLNSGLHPFTPLFKLPHIHTLACSLSGYGSTYPAEYLPPTPPLRKIILYSPRSVFPFPFSLPTLREPRQLRVQKFKQLRKEVRESYVGRRFEVRFEEVVFNMGNEGDEDGKITVEDDGVPRGFRRTETYFVDRLRWTIGTYAAHATEEGNEVMEDDWMKVAPRLFKGDLEGKRDWDVVTGKAEEYWRKGWMPELKVVEIVVCEK